MSTKDLSLRTDDMSLSDQIRALKAAGVIPSNMQEGAAVGVGIVARELGIPLAAAFRTIHVIEGKPTLSADAMMALAWQRLPGLQLRLDESTSEVCTMSMRRDAASEWVTMTYRYSDAQTAGLTHGSKGIKANWKRHPDDMLRARVKSKLLRTIAADVFVGIYTPEEAEDIAPRTVDYREVPNAAADVSRRLGIAPAVQAEVLPAEAAPVEAMDASELRYAEWCSAIDDADAVLLAKYVESIKADADLSDEHRSALGAKVREVAAARGWTKAK